MYGWRARIALIIAHSNTVMEPEFTRLAPEGVSIHTTRFRIGGISVEGNQISDESLVHAVGLVSELNARAFAFACTAANIAAGTSGDVAQARRITELTGQPTVTAAAALVEALTALGARRIGVATPYPADLQESAKAFWREAGFEIVTLTGVDLGGHRRPAEPLSPVPVSHVGLQGPHVAYNLARSAVAKGVEAVVVSGAGLRTIEVAEQFERDFGIPFVSSSLATIWAALQAAEVRESISGYGRLLDLQPALSWTRIPRV